MVCLAHHLRVLGPVVRLASSQVEMDVTFPFSYFLLRLVTTHMLLSQYATGVCQRLVQRSSTPPSSMGLSVLAAALLGVLSAIFVLLWAHYLRPSPSTPFFHALRPVGLGLLSFCLTILRLRITPPP